jgi:hypothetical protein
MSTSTLAEHVATVRRFNRFYTRQIGVLRTVSRGKDWMGVWNDMWGWSVGD